MSDFSRIYGLNIGEKIDISENEIQKLVSFISNRDAMDYYCENCSKIKTFIQKNDENIIIRKTTVGYCSYKMYSVRNVDDEIVYSDIISYGGDKKIKFFPTIDEYYIFKIFKCPTCENELLIIFYYKNSSITKIYQSYISNIMSDEDILKYKKLKLLNDDDLTEIEKANECKKLGYHCASLLYIRRIFESLLQRIYEYNKEKINLPENKSSFEICTVKEKVKCLKNYLPQVLNNGDDKGYYSKTYKLLSEGVHKLDEGTCETLFAIVYDIVVLILEKETEQLSVQNKIKDLEKNYNKIFNKKN